MELTHILDGMPLAEKKIFEKLFSILSIENLTPEERTKYERSEAAYLEDMYAYEYAKQQGEAEGEAKGIRLVARNLKQKGMDIALIMQTTGLSEAEINTL
jgi:predicted transposase/invertase (TIGR01784 family)